MRIPLVAYGGPFTGGHVVREMTGLIDLPRTILECAGVEVPAHMRGVSLKELVEGKTPCYRDTIFIQISESQVGRCIRTPRWKYSVQTGADGWTVFSGDVYYEDCLYDLEADPAEHNNLVEDPSLAPVRAMLAARLQWEMLQAGEASPTILPRAARPR